MKRIQTACLHQTIHFQLKDNVPAEIAQRLVREEEKEYQENLNRRGVPYRIWDSRSAGRLHPHPDHPSAERLSHRGFSKLKSKGARTERISVRAPFMRSF